MNTASVSFRMLSGARTIVLLILVFLTLVQRPSFSQEHSGETLYVELSEELASGNNSLVEKLNVEPRAGDWQNAKQAEFRGHLRLLTSSREGKDDERKIYFIRSAAGGDIYLLNIPDRASQEYASLDELMESKLIFNVSLLEMEIEGKAYNFAQFITTPVQPTFDKVFRIAIILMLFLVMVGMGLTLTAKDFAAVITKPKGFIVGEILQFGIMPLVAAGFGYLLGFHENYPYIYVGMILITATPGGVTSNLMTHYAKGDVALSVSLTSLSTVLSILFVPLLLNAYCSNIPDVKVPTGTITSTIVILVIVPLAIGMIFRRYKETLAKKLIPVFNILGIIALLFLIVAGIINNIEGFADTDRYGFSFYSMILLLTLSGMVVGALFPFLLKVSNFQIRAISLETGLRNASLAMTIALLIQDSMGDFHSSMFWVSGMFGLSMYIAGLIAIKLYPKLFPVEESK